MNPNLGNNDLRLGLLWCLGVCIALRMVVQQVTLRTDKCLRHLAELGNLAQRVLQLSRSVHINC